MKINMEVKFIVSLLFSILVTIFAIQNAGSVDINFLFGKFTISQAVVILGSAILGALIVLLLGLIKQIKQSMKIKQLTKEIAKLTEDKNALQVKFDELVVGLKEEKEIKNKEDISIEVKDEIVNNNF